MSARKEAARAIHQVDGESAERRNNTTLHPLAFFGVTILFLLCTASFGKYELTGLCGMLLFLIPTAILRDISLTRALGRLKYMMALLLAVGIPNLFFDRTPFLQIGALTVSGGMVSLTTLFLKGVFMLWASYFMVVSIGMKGVCHALRALRVPGIFLTVLTLMYRYCIVLMNEVERMWISYHMRAPGQKGIHIRFWGAFLGLLLMRSIDRAERIYAGMQLRGYCPEEGMPAEELPYHRVDSILYVVFWASVFYVLRSLPIFSLVGGWVTGW